MLSKSKSLAYGVGKILNLFNKEACLCNGLYDVYNVNFLKAVSSKLIGCYIACDCNKRNAVARPVTMFVAPGPDVVITTPVLPVALA